MEGLVVAQEPGRNGGKEGQCSHRCEYVRGQAMPTQEVAAPHTETRQADRKFKRPFATPSPASRPAGAAHSTVERGGVRPALVLDRRLRMG